WPQNRKPAGTSAPHCGQRGARGAPQRPQKRMPGGLSNSHAAQRRPPGGMRVLSPTMTTHDAHDESWSWPEERWRAAVDKVRAGRSLKPKQWKGGASVCVALSFDPDHETGTLREGSTSVGRLSQGQYGNRAGTPRILDLLRRHDIKASFFVPGVVAKLYPDEQTRIVAEGHEIGMHGWIHERTSPLAEDVERELMGRAFETLTKATGRQPVGVRVPSWDFSPNTLKLIREMGLLYDSSLMADDEPYELMEDGVATGVVELPVE